tara:strand:+ start:46 stop:612 length:567 start_codon:yes stop_codon:yes gene_type:complete
MVMILECKSCQKKFIVPDSAITNAGRLVQCSACGNKWTQFPVTKKAIKETINFPAKNEALKKAAKLPPKIQKEKNFNTPEKKKKIVKKKSGPSIYSKEYLEKKHGIKIDRNNLKASKNKSEKKTSHSYFGFYSYLIVFLFTIISMIGILNLTKEIIIFNFPFTETYIEYLFENLNNFGILFRDTFYLY